MQRFFDWKSFFSLQNKFSSQFFESTLTPLNDAMNQFWEKKNFVLKLLDGMIIWTRSLPRSFLGSLLRSLGVISHSETWFLLRMSLRFLEKFSNWIWKISFSAFLKNWSMINVKFLILTFQCSDLLRMTSIWPRNDLNRLKTGLNLKVLNRNRFIYFQHPKFNQKNFVWIIYPQDVPEHGFVFQPKK